MICRGSAGGDDWLDEPPRPGEQQPCGEQQVALHEVPETGSCAVSPVAVRCGLALQKRGHGRRCVDLDHPVQVANVKPEFKRRGGDDHAVPTLGERVLGPVPLVKRQRSVDQVRRDAEFPELRAEFLDELLGVAEDEALLSPVQRAMTFAAFAVLPT